MAWTNINKCRSRKLAVADGVWSKLDDIQCSEVIIYAEGGSGNGSVAVADGSAENVNDAAGVPEAGKVFLMHDEATFTFKGLTNASQLSAKGSGAASDLYYRTQMYSEFPQH